MHPTSLCIPPFSDTAVDFQIDPTVVHQIFVYRLLESPRHGKPQSWRILFRKDLIYTGADMIIMGISLASCNACRI